MTNKVGSPHDRFVRRCLSDLELAKAFFRRFLKPKQVKAVDLERLEPGGKDSFVGKDLNSLVTDLLFMAPIHNHTGFLSLLVEHKSEGALRGTGHILPFQMRSQEVMIMDYGRRNHPKLRYPLVYMVALYHGVRPYSGPTAVGEHIEAPSEMVPERWNENIELIDLTAYRDEDLIADGKLGVFLLVLKHIYATDILQTLEFLAPQMHKIEQEQGDDFIMTVFRYLFEATRVEKREPMLNIAIKTLSKEAGVKMMTIADSFRQEGKIEGKIEGRLEGKIEVAQLLLAEKQPFETIMRLTNLTLEQIRALANQNGNLGSV